MSNENQGLVTISAKVEASKRPNQVSIDIAFYDELDEREDCIAQYNRDLETVLHALHEVGIENDSVKQSGFKVYPHKEEVYEKVDEDEDGGNYYYRCETIKGYEYTSHATITMEADEDAYGKVWLVLLETNGSFTFEFEFDLKNEEAVERELLAKAVKQAQSRAEILAEAAGGKLGDVMSINHTMRNAYSGYGLDYMHCESPRPSSYGKRNLIPDFNPEDITVCCSVDVAWSIDKLE